MTIAALFLIGGRVVSAYPRQPASWFVLLLCMTTVAHVALARMEYGPWIPEPYRFAFGGAEPALDVARNMGPSLFALLAQTAFTDRRRIPIWLLSLLALQFALEVAPYLIGGERALNFASALLQIAFAALAIIWTVAYWRVDLIEERRRSRAVMAILLAVNGVASSILLRLIIPPDIYLNYLGHVALTVFAALAILVLVARMMGGDVGPYLGQEQKPRRSAAAARDREDAEALARLEKLIAEQRPHLEPGLSIARLAAQLGTPEYRLRRLIHEHLGFRNFNAFLHAHRVRAAAEQLSDPAKRRTPILTIALSCGYESINTFNRGFRDVMGENPSEYRTRQLSTFSTSENSPNSE